MRVVVTGAAGMLGGDVVTVARAEGHEVTALSHEDLDVTDPSRVDRVVGRERPDVVVNCAAYTAVDAAEEDAKRAELVNAQGAGFVADAAAKADARVIYVSTDYVFDGSKQGPYRESDDTNPINVYGRTKLGGERATALVTKRSFIVRTSWLFGPRGGNFVETMLRAGQGGGPVVVVHDQVGCPTYTGHLAIGIVRLLDSTAFGYHHMSGSGSCSWYEFALEIFRQAEVVTRVMATTTEMMQRPAPRPKNSVLISGREAAITLPDWQRGLADYLARRAQPEPEPEPSQAKPKRSSATRRQPALDWDRMREHEEETEGDEAAPGSAAGDEPGEAEGPVEAERGEGGRE